MVRWSQIPVLRSLPYYLRKKTSKKIVLIESDDWGLERASSEASMEYLEKKYGRENFSRWTTDALETPEDLHQLYTVLGMFKNSFESPPVITANFITHNIDYDRQDGLYFKSLTQGFNKGSESPMEQYHQGIKEHFIAPQLHGFSHFNQSILETLFRTDEGKELFKNKVLPLLFTLKDKRPSGYKFWANEMGNSPAETEKIIQLAQSEFERFFGFKSISLIPPNYLMTPDNIGVIYKAGIRALQSANAVVKPGSRNLFFIWNRPRQGLYGLTRLCRLDPDEVYKNYADKCYKEVINCFKMGIPATIDCHRVNFSGRFNKPLRDTTMEELATLFTKLKNEHPDTIFMSTPQLYQLLSGI